MKPGDIADAISAGLLASIWVTLIGVALLLERIAIALEAWSP